MATATLRQQTDPMLEACNFALVPAMRLLAKCQECGSLYARSHTAGILRHAQACSEKAARTAWDQLLAKAKAGFLPSRLVVHLELSGETEAADFVLASMSPKCRPQ